LACLLLLCLLGLVGHTREDLRPGEEQLAGELDLRARHGHVDEGLRLGGKRREHVTLEPTDHEGVQQLAALCDHHLVDLAAREVEGLVKGVRVGEELWV